jgi:hypothetical protein
MKRILRIIGAFLLLVLLLVGGFVGYYWQEVSGFPATPSSYEAKELCSCLFVENRPQKDCEQFIKQNVVPIDSRAFDLPNKRVTVKALWISSSAKYISAKYGCVIE